MAERRKKGTKGRLPEKPPDPAPEPVQEEPEVPHLPPMLPAPLEGGGRVLLSRVTTMCAAGLVEDVEVRGEIYGFTLSDLELLLDLKRTTVLNLIRSGELDPGDLESICFQWYRRAQSQRFKRRWPITPAERHLEAERIRSCRRAKKKKRTYHTPDGKTRTIELPDPQDL